MRAPVGAANRASTKLSGRGSRFARCGSVRESTAIAGGCRVSCAHDSHAAARTGTVARSDRQSGVRVRARAVPFRARVHRSSRRTEGLVAAWFGGTRERNPDVGIWVARHDGNAWSAPVEVANGVQPDGTRHPCWNPVLFQPSNGPLVLFYKVGPSPSAWWGLARTSADGGRTWSAAVEASRGHPRPDSCEADRALAWRHARRLEHGERWMDRAHGTIRGPVDDRRARRRIELAEDTAVEHGRGVRRDPADDSRSRPVVARDPLPHASGRDRASVVPGCRRDLDKAGRDAAAEPERRHRRGEPARRRLPAGLQPVGQGTLEARRSRGRPTASHGSRSSPSKTRPAASIRIPR